MMIKRLCYALPFVIFSSSVFSAATPRPSTYDSHMQTVTYNSQNSTIVNARAGYVSTLVFDDGEEVIRAQAGFEKGWSITPTDNQVDIRPAPIEQPVTDEMGATASQVFLPNAKDWRTNLIVVTSRRTYSFELNVLDDDQPDTHLAYVVRFSYPDDVRMKTSAEQTAKEAELREAHNKSRIEAALVKATAPRNWNYNKRVAIGAEIISPDFAYDDGRFTYLGFSPQKTIPSPFVIVNGKEQVTTPTFIEQGNYKVMTVRSISPRFVLRHGNAVVGIENASYGKIAIAAGDTVSPDVKLEAK